MEVSPVNQPGTISAPLPTETGNSSAMISSDFETFLLMLTTQMENQDPLNPIDSSDYAVQLATFSGVEQQVRTNQLLEGLAEQMNLTGMAQLAGWVGMEARAAAPVQFDGAPIILYPKSAPTAEQAVLVVQDARGNTVDRVPVAASADPITWDGLDQFGNPRQSGLYSFSLESYAHDDLIATSDVDAYSQITEARSQAGETILIMQGGVEVTASEITALRDPGTSF